MVCLLFALVPNSGKLLLGRPGETPEFLDSSRLSMMFGAGIGIGMLTVATAEPIYHFGNNPNVIRGFSTGYEADNVGSAYRWSFLHWGVSAWACCALVGLGWRTSNTGATCPSPFDPVLHPYSAKIFRDQSAVLLTSWPFWQPCLAWPKPWALAFSNLLWACTVSVLQTGC